MHSIDAANAAEYLRQAGWIAPAERVQVERMAGGVSNEVFYVQRLDQADCDFVLKQARPQLRTPDPWFSSVERIWREVEVLRLCERLLRVGQLASLHARALRATTPQVLFEDRPNYAFAMSAAPREHKVWKQALLAGEVSQSIAEQCGTLLGVLHAGSWKDAKIAQQLGDRRLFDELRLDPYYRTTARAFPEFCADFERLVASTSQQACSLVHADFSPKNLLVYGGGLMMVDFETGHYGDPAFDLGFFLSHLVLKAFYRAPAHETFLQMTQRFWLAYGGVVEPAVSSPVYKALVARAIDHCAGCMWARIDGKSQVEYLVDSPRRAAVRAASQHLLRAAPGNWEGVLTEFRRRLENN